MSFPERRKHQTAEDAEPVRTPERAPSAAKHEILLDLGDFLARIPPEFLHDGPHPAEAALQFDIADLAERIARGHTCIRLAEIYRRVPEIFREEILPLDETEIRFPWQKVMTLLAAPQTGLTPAAAESLAEKLRARRATRNIIPGMSEMSADDTKAGHERELAAFAQEASRRVQELTAERNALAQQQAVLSRQVAEFQKHGKPGVVPGMDTPGPSRPSIPERSPKEHQRQVDELQRRIAALESHQREAAIEVGREKEARIRLERQLGMADRLSRESAVQVEEMLAAVKRDFETTARKREAGAARAQREAQEQFEAVNAARARLAAELEEARARLARAPAAEAWEARAVARFEEDIENYRSRIRALLAERDTLAREVETLAADRPQVHAL